MSAERSVGFRKPTSAMVFRMDIPHRNRPITRMILFASSSSREAPDRRVIASTCRSIVLANRTAMEADTVAS